MASAPSLYQIMVAARPSYDTESLTNILTVVIMIAIVLIGNIAQAKTRRQPRPRRGPISDPDLPPGDPGTDQRLEETLDLPAQNGPRPAAYAPGGFGEVLEEQAAQAPEKSAFERFIEMKDVPVERLRSPETPVTQLELEPERLDELDIHEEEFEIDGVDGSEEIFSEEEVALRLSFESLEDAILYREILGPPVGFKGNDHLFEVG